MVNERDLVSKVLDVLKGAPKPLPISAISRQAVLDRHTVSHILEILSISGQIICLHQGAAKKYYLNQNFLHPSVPLAPADLIIIVDDASNLIYVNEIAKQWMKTPIVDITGKKLDSISHPVLILPEFFRNLREADSQRVVHITLKTSRDEGILFYPVTITQIGIPSKGTGLLIIIEEAINNNGEQASFRREFLEHLNPGLVVADLQGEIMYANPSFQLSLGYTDELDIFNHGITDILNVDSQFIETLVHLGNNLHHFREKTLKKKDGTPICCLVHLELVKSPLGDPLYISGIMIDLSGRGEFKDKIVNLEKRYRDIVESTSDVIWETGADLCYTYVSPAITTLTGYLPRELVGTPPLWLSDKKTGESTIDFWSLLKTSNRCTSAFTRQHSLEHKNGHRVIVETRAVPILSSTGKFMGYRGIDRDITEDTTVRTKLLESEKKYRDIFDNAVMGIFQTAPGGRIINVNNAFAHMYGFSDAAEMLAADLNVGSPPYANPEDRQEVLRILAQNGKVEDYEALHLKRDGTCFWVSITARIIRDTEGNILLFEGTIIDITERKRAENALKKSELLFREVFKNANDSVFLIERTPNGPGKYLLVNDKAVQMLGYSKEELLEMSPRDIVPEDIAKKIGIVLIKHT